MPMTGPLHRVSARLDTRRHDGGRRPVEGTSIRLGALLVFLGLIVLMVLTASPSMAAAADADPRQWDRVITLAPILFWVAVGIGVTVRVVLGRRQPRSVDATIRTASTPASTTGSSSRPEHATAA